jgi:hypothetical protein
MSDDYDIHMNAQYGPCQHNQNLRPCRTRDNGPLHTTLEHTAMNQYNTKRGIKEFGDDGANAVVKELQQLHDRQVLQPIDSKTLSPQEKKSSLQYLMFLKRKLNGTIKGRGCADGQKERDYISKEDSSSPTVAIDLFSCPVKSMTMRTET